ncbi:hypothetical protein CDL15_Pgr004512 [Punica granatum]|uniref:Uncharacterized protein n=1 Tax=Punica granatum TaxID=22663 RepID=A0A218WZ25_PUNGR|nr:hypothetical protein CDL15_Pgr004512 [Punica granatum]
MKKKCKEKSSYSTSKSIKKRGYKSKGRFKDKTTAEREHMFTGKRKPRERRYQKRKPGKPKTKRKKATEEDANPHKMKRKLGPPRCSRCKQVGHKKTSCKTNLGDEDTTAATNETRPSHVPVDGANEETRASQLPGEGGSAAAGDGTNDALATTQDGHFGPFPSQPELQSAQPSQTEHHTTHGPWQHFPSTDDLANMQVTHPAGLYMLKTVHAELYMLGYAEGSMLDCTCWVMLKAACWIVHAELDEFDVPGDKIDVTRDELDVTRDEFDVTRDDFDVTREEFDVPRVELDVTRDEFDVTRDEFDVTRDEFDVTRDEFDVTRDEFDVTRDEFDLTIFSSTQMIQFA